MAFRDEFDPIKVNGTLTGQGLAFWPELRLLACFLPLLGPPFVNLLANICVLYHILSGKSMEIEIKLRDLTLFP